MSAARAAIVGAAETDQLGTIPDKSSIQLAAESSLRALADAGLSLADVDGVATAASSAVDLNPIELSYYMGLSPRWMDGTNTGGCSFLQHVRHAVAAIAADQASVVLIAHGESGRSRQGNPPYVLPPQSPRAQFEAPYGILHPPTLFTLPVLRYMKDMGLTHEQLASVAVMQRRWSHDNPRAKGRDLITVQDVLDSPMIAYPFHLLECCLVTDGGGALVVVSADRARELRSDPVYIRGDGEGAETPIISQMRDFTRSGAFEDAGREAFRSARMTTEDIDHLMIYDAFAHLPIFGLEALGFVARGEAGAFIEEGHTAPGGKLPMNTNGGGLSYTHTGMYGMFAIQESVRQLRGSAAVPVPNVTTGMVLGVGGMFMSAAALILSTEAG